MPELPEVEVTRRSFVSAIENATILDVYCGKPLRWPLGIASAELIGRRVRTVRRRGKYLLLDLDAGMLLLHLGMSGSLSFGGHLPARGTHDHFELRTSQGTLRLNDPRRFGAVVFAPHEDAPQARKLLGGLGMEPLSPDFDLERFHAGLKRRKAAVKQVLLAGDVVVGVGNIYASETLFMAGIRPTRSAAKLGLARVGRLRAAIREVLERAVNQGGSTLRNFSSANGEVGHFQLDAMVYGREGQACRLCTTPIRRVWQGQRATYFCPVCQKN